MSSRFLLLFPAVLAATSALAADGISGFVRTSGTQFIDARGKPLILHGINVENKNKAEGYTGDLGAADFKAIRGMGMNCVRLTIFWDGFEPQPGKFDKDYLERIARLVAQAKAEGLYVLLDMHQDLYSVKFSDGAPEWATLDEGRPHTKGRVWSDAYSQSEAVQTALDNFWANKPGPDGIGLQDHLATVWQTVARRFAAEPAVVGYDILNEPAPGRDFARVRQASLAALPAILGKPPEEVRQLATGPDAGKHMLEWMRDPERFLRIMDSGAAVVQEFERSRLMPFLNKMARAIRSVDKRHILFIEPAVMANVGIRTAITPLTDSAGRRDPLQAFAPHIYDITTDSGPTDAAGPARLSAIMKRLDEASQRLGMPMLIGEWGAYYLDAKAAAQARFLLSEFDRYRCSDTYWSYSRKLPGSPLAAALSRIRIR